MSNNTKNERIYNIALELQYLFQMKHDLLIQGYLSNAIFRLFRGFHFGSIKPHTYIDKNDIFTDKLKQVIENILEFSQNYYSSFTKEEKVNLLESFDFVKDVLAIEINRYNIKKEDYPFLVF